MSVPLNQALRVGAYVVKQHLLGRKRYPLVLMLEPLHTCNLTCTAGALSKEIVTGLLFTCGCFWLGRRRLKLISACFRPASRQ